MLLEDPRLASRSCAHCLKFIYGDDGRPTVGRDGELEEREFFGRTNGKLNCPPACQTDHGCRKGTPEKPITLSDMNLQCYQHYKECRAVGQFPDDSKVRENAAIIREVEDEYERKLDEKRQLSIVEAVRKAIHG